VGKKTNFIYNEILSDSPFDKAIAKTLTDIGSLYPENAWHNLKKIFKFIRKIHDSDKILLKLVSFITDSFEPDRALNNLEKFLVSVKSPEKYISIIQKDEEFLKNVITLFSGSQYLSNIAVKDEKNINSLIDGNIDAPKEKENLFKELRSLLSPSYTPEENYSTIRKFKKREYLRIGLRDLLRKGSFSEIVKELSDVADVCLQSVYEISERELIKKYGEPYYRTADGEKRPSEFAIISLGKLGGRELNFSSDIDILYLYSSDDGETRGVKTDENEYEKGIKLHEFYVKLSQMITNVLSEITEDGNIFRVDLRLRPEGKKGDIAYSLRSYEIYYESWGETWERQSLIKSRISAGSKSLGNEFIKMIHPFIYRKFLDYTAIEEIRKIKERIDANLLSKGKDKDNVKLGYGGIREIEFFVQSFQLIFGGKNPSIQEQNTLNALKMLLKEEFITDDDYTKLVNAYIFLRELENRIQLSYGIQKHIIPDDMYEKSVLARKMGISGSYSENLASQLLELYNFHIKNVREIYDSLFHKEKEEKSPYFIITSEDEDVSLKYMKDFNFIEPRKAISTIILLREGESFTHPSRRSKALFDKLLPDILKEIKTLPEPDLALSNFERFVLSSGSGENVYSFMIENEKVRELLLTLFGTSKFLSDILILRPESLDAILNPDEWMVSKSKERLYKELSESLSKISLSEKKMSEMRKFKKIEELRIGLRVLALDADLLDTFMDLSNLADVYLECSLEISKRELSRRYGVPQIVKNSKKRECPMTITGLGKLGGQELDFSSDLDLIFVYEDEGLTSGIGEVNHENKNIIPNHIYFNKLYENIYNAVSGITETGYAYKIDLRLRPEGKKGAPIISLKRFEEYFKTRAETWERQALVKTRITAGDKELGNKFINLVEKFVYESKFVKENIYQIKHIRERIENELAEENEIKKDFKLGYGGIVDIEFIIQTLQLKYGGKFPELRIPNTVKALKVLESKGIFDKIDASNILNAYKFLRRIENRLRIMHDTSLHSFNITEEEIESLAVRMKYINEKSKDAGEALLVEYNRHTENIREIYKKIFNKLLLEKD